MFKHDANTRKQQLLLGNIFPNYGAGAATSKYIASRGGVHWPPQVKAYLHPTFLSVHPLKMIYISKSKFFSNTDYMHLNLEEDTY